MIGDWWEEYVALPLLESVAKRLDLYLDCRFKERSCRGEKILWKDIDGNDVDYDFVLELGGSADKQGIPVAFVETFWRRGSRHSKDKARDDSGKLLPMRNTYPTARFVSILALGDFTAPAKQYVSSRDIKLFYIPKAKAVEAFKKNNLIIDYPDKMVEPEKLKLVEKFEKDFTEKAKSAVEKALKESVGLSSFKAYQDDFNAALSALPQEIRIVRSLHSVPVVFTNIRDAAEFLKTPTFGDDVDSTTYHYYVQYSDGSDFDRELGTIEEVRALNEQLAVLANHMERLAEKAVKVDAEAANN